MHNKMLEQETTDIRYRNSLLSIHTNDTVS